MLLFNILYICNIITEILLCQYLFWKYCIFIKINVFKEFFKFFLLFIYKSSIIQSTTQRLFVQYIAHVNVDLRTRTESSLFRFLR